MKKILAVLLAALLAVSVFGLAASAESGCACGYAPIVLIDGINARDLVMDRGTENARVVFPFADDAIQTLITDHREAVWDLLDTNFSAESEREITEAIKDLVAGTEMTEAGDSLYNVTIDWDYPESADHSNGEYFKFCYDWRQDPFVSAAGLRDFIGYVKELTGHDTVHLAGFSQGATVLNTYLHEYGYGGLETVIWYCGAQRGVDIVGKLFSGRIHVDADDLTGYLHGATGDGIGYELLSFLVQGLTDIGATGVVTDMVNRSLGHFYEDGAIRDVILATFGRMPGIWSLMADTYYEEAKAALFCEPGDAETYAALIERIDRYHYEVQANSDAIMQGAKDAAGKVAVLVKYNLRELPVVTEADCQTDGQIDTFRASCGATCAPVGETLGAGYVQKVADGHDHLSADGVIDASTALFPEYTWFVKNAEHSADCPYMDALVRAICEAEGQPDVFGNPAYPQFAARDPETGEVSPLTAQNDGSGGEKAVVRLRNFFAALKERIVLFFKKLFDR